MAEFEESELETFEVVGEASRDEADRLVTDSKQSSRISNSSDSSLCKGERQDSKSGVAGDPIVPSAGDGSIVTLLVINDVLAGESKARCQNVC